MSAKPGPAQKLSFCMVSTFYPPYHSGGDAMYLYCLANALARRGHRVTGVDFNPRYLEMAAEEARRAGVEVRFIAADMRELEFAREFAGVYSFFTSFGYFSDAGNEQGRIHSGQNGDHIVPQ